MMSMMPERLGPPLAQLPEWRAVLTAAGQALERTFRFASYESALLFASALSAAADRRSLFPRLEIEPLSTEGAPTRVKVAIPAAALGDEHADLAHAVNTTHANLAADTGASTPVPPAPPGAAVHTQ